MLRALLVALLATTIIAVLSIVTGPVPSDPQRPNPLTLDPEKAQLPLIVPTAALVALLIVRHIAEERIDTGLLEA